MYLKVMHGNQLTSEPEPSDNPHTLYADIESCSFHRLRPEETQVPGTALAQAVAYIGGEKRVIDLHGAAYLMNEQGRTISTFTPWTVIGYAGGPVAGGQDLAQAARAS